MSFIPSVSCQPTPHALCFHPLALTRPPSFLQHDATRHVPCTRQRESQPYQTHTQRTGHNALRHAHPSPSRAVGADVPTLDPPSPSARTPVPIRTKCIPAPTTRTSQFTRLNHNLRSHPHPHPRYQLIRIWDAPGRARGLRHICRHRHPVRSACIYSVRERSGEGHVHASVHAMGVRRRTQTRSISAPKKRGRRHI